MRNSIQHQANTTPNSVVHSNGKCKKWTGSPSSGKYIDETVHPGENGCRKVTKITLREKDSEKRQVLYIVGGNDNEFTHYGKHSGGSSKK